MVAAIVIPILFIYFFWITKREIKEQALKWLHAGDVPDEAIFTGKIIEVITDKQRFYYNRYIFVQELKFQTETRLMAVRKVTPITKHFNPENFNIGENLRIYGGFRDGHFYINHVEKIGEPFAIPKKQ